MQFSFKARLRKLISYERYKLQMLIESVCKDAMRFASERDGARSVRDFTSISDDGCLTCTCDGNADANVER